MVFSVQGKTMLYLLSIPALSSLLNPLDDAPAQSCVIALPFLTTEPLNTQNTHCLQYPIEISRPS